MLMCPILSLIPPRSLAENTSDPKSHCDLTTRAARGIFTVRSGYFLSGYPLLCKPCSDGSLSGGPGGDLEWSGYPLLCKPCSDLILSAYSLRTDSMMVRIPLALQALFGQIDIPQDPGQAGKASGYPLLCKPCSDRRLRPFRSWGSAW